MKAELTATGTLVLTPENGTDAFALMCWTERAVVEQPDTKRGETFHWRGSSIMVDLGAFPETLRSVFDQEKWAREWREATPGGWPARKER